MSRQPITSSAHIRVKSGPALRILRLIELIAALTAIIAILLWFRFEYPAMQQDRMTSAWTLMNMNGSGGKKQALEFLAKQAVRDNEELLNIDLSSETHGPGRVRLYKLQAANLKFKFANFSEADLSGANLTNAKISKSNFSEILTNNLDLRRAEISETDFSNTVFDEVDLRDAKFSNVNFSNAIFTATARLDQDQLEKSWACIGLVFFGGFHGPGAPEDAANIYGF